MEIVTQVAAVLLVLSLLFGVKYWLSRNASGLGIFRAQASAKGRLRLLQCLKLSHQHSLHLVQVDDSVLVVALHPSGCTLLQNRGRDPLTSQVSVPDVGVRQEPESAA